MARLLSIPVIAMALLCAAGLAAAPAHAQIGVASVVKNEVNGSRGGQVRVLRVGTSVFQNEVITTGASSSAQLLFRDETSLTLGANSQMTLDRFVYDPNAKSGDITVTIAKGAFRFITGSADPRSYKIRTPVATVGVRGTIVEGYLSILTGLFTIVVPEGQVLVTLLDGTVITLNAGQSLTLNANGQIVSGPETWTGPMLDMDAGVKFVLDEMGRLENEGGDVLPQWNEFNDALKSRDLDITFPPGGDGDSGYGYSMGKTPGDDSPPPNLLIERQGDR